MTIIADSGSTKTKWLLVKEEGDFLSVETKGLNPHFIGYEDVMDVLQKEIYPHLCDSSVVESLSFYGSGCGNSRMKSKIYSPLADFFHQATVCVEADMLAAARALAGRDAGIVGILGTGSNLCVYDGNTIVEQQNSLGFILGDEGSGNYIGKKLLSNYFYGKMPKNIQTKFEEKYAPNLLDILNNVYHQPFPNKFLADFAYFACENQENFFINSLLTQCFDDFFQINMALFEKKDLPLYLLGGVANNFQEIIRHSAEKYHIKIAKIEQDPMKGLKGTSKNSTF
ncbi:MAG: ATPase [Bacteroidales bacterium]|jgi:N-acetylglucosamine kinase-like BadF-type ATPase|nr:ATPase [Bacteroidales bacterium]